MRTVGYQQLRFLRPKCGEKETLTRSLLVAEVVMSTLRRKVLPCSQETTSEFAKEQTLPEELVKTDERAQLAELEIVGTP